MNELDLLLIDIHNKMEALAGKFGNSKEYNLIAFENYLERIYKIDCNKEE